MVVVTVDTCILPRSFSEHAYRALHRELGITRESILLACSHTHSSPLLDNSLVMYGGAMGNGNLHNHKRCPIFLAGHAGGAVEGGLHLKTPDGTPAANMHLTLLKKLGFDDMGSFGDSTGTLDL